VPERTALSPCSHRNGTAVPSAVIARPRTFGVYATFNVNNPHGLVSNQVKPKGEQKR
jgi:hypothetical protein